MFFWSLFPQTNGSMTRRNTYVCERSSTDRYSAIPNGKDSRYAHSQFSMFSVFFILVQAIFLSIFIAHNTKPGCTNDQVVLKCLHPWSPV